MPSALVVLSGGQDSVTCAAIASQKFEQVHAVTFNYGQRHKIEIDAAIATAKALKVVSHEIVDLGPILKGTSPLISDNSLGVYNTPEELPSGVEPTFVPGRNLLFLILAANRAAVLGVRDIYTGLCQEDFAGYWDCRQVFVDKMRLALGEGIYGDAEYFTIHTPLMDLTKAESVQLAVDTLGDRFEEVFENTHTCYAGVKGGCGKCHACILRDRGFNQAGVTDPIWKYRHVHSLG